MVKKNKKFFVFYVVTIFLVLPLLAIWAYKGERTSIPQTWAGKTALVVKAGTNDRLFSCHMAEGDLYRLVSSTNSAVRIKYYNLGNGSDCPSGAELLVTIPKQD